jgi:hypothetical protein
MKAWLFLLLIAVGVGVLPLACLLTVDRLHRGEPLQTILESLPTRMIDIYGEVLADQLKWLHIAQAQPTSSPSPAPTPKDIVSSISPQPMKESASSPAQDATVPDFRDNDPR